MKIPFASQGETCKIMKIVEQERYSSCDFNFKYIYFLMFFFSLLHE